MNLNPQFTQSENKMKYMKSGLNGKKNKSKIYSPKHLLWTALNTYCVFCHIHIDFYPYLNYY